MPLHKPELYCLKDKNLKTHDTCSCQHCTLAVCRVCGAYEGGLTQDCPGVKISGDVAALVHENGLDYTDSRGWFMWLPAELNTPEYQRRNIRFEPTAKGIIKRLSELNVTSPPAEGSREKALFELKTDALYWLNNREGRQ